MLWETTNRNGATEEGQELGNYQALLKNGSPVLSDRRKQGKPEENTKTISRADWLLVGF